MLTGTIGLIKGAIIGIGAILPGISGGILMMAMGIYRPIMELMAHPFSTLSQRWKFFLPLIIGFGVGVLGLSRLVEALFAASPTPAVWLFAGLIFGTMPDLWRESGEQGRGKAAIAAFAAVFLAALMGMMALNRGGGAQVTPTTWVWALCGALWGLGFAAPGLSPSAMFIYMGVYQAMAAGIADLNLSVLVPMGLGFLASAALLSRLMTYLMKRAYALTMHAILGIALAGAVIILPIGSAADWRQALAYGLCFLGGLGAALAMGKLNQKFAGEMA